MRDNLTGLDPSYDNVCQSQGKRVECKVERQQEGEQNGDHGVMVDGEEDNFLPPERILGSTWRVECRD